MKITGDQLMKMSKDNRYNFWSRIDFPGIRVKLSILKVQAIANWIGSDLLGARIEYQGDKRVDVSLYRIRN